MTFVTKDKTVLEEPISRGQESDALVECDSIRAKSVSASNPFKLEIVTVLPPSISWYPLCLESKEIAGDELTKSTNM